ncbi:cytochrome P450 [Tilletiaria anomala UBC 951]|uniref:Cytochrome P450 n=1 Tax=Tilletiaria anomala (strain ATCC 24038 / CBS 436.72 / UBC 951) TaxID=1037660 RepID=A0A066VRM0_TILAU|nr:cytochrome P450 [Tilletiaria anomala UBC 951]KDN41235.1 cytochrome P450 [Tilletiaria anomala UBC 951]
MHWKARRTPTSVADHFLDGQIKASHVASPQLTLLVASIAFAVFLFWLLFVPPKRLHHSINNVPILPCRFPGLGAVGFFGNRYTFLNKMVTKDPARPHEGIAKFNLFGHIVYHVGSNDEATMRAIAQNPDLSFSQGNSLLFAGIQGAGQKGLDDGGEMDAEERKEMRDLAKAISPRRLADITPVLASDAVKAFDEWIARSPKSPTTRAALIDLQQTYYPLIFQFSVRMMGLSEYASAPAELSKLMWAFWLTQRNAGFWTTLVPWLPQPQLIKRLVGAATLWIMVRASVKKRIEEGRREDDYAQTLIDEGHSPGKISRFVIGGLIAGILNTIGTGAYVLAWIGADAKLKKVVRDEIEDLCKKSAEKRGEVYEELTNEERLTRVTLEEWESGLETLMLCFRESIRFLLTNSINRYYPGPRRDTKGNVRPRLKLLGHEIEDNAYVVYSPSSNLHSADAFSDPWRFDPFRYKRGEGQTEYTMVGWGFGHHRCTGIRFAKLETIMATATFMLCNDFVTVNDKDEPYGPQEVPLPDLSQLHWREPRRPIRLRVHKLKSD